MSPEDLEMRWQALRRRRSATVQDAIKDWIEHGLRTVQVGDLVPYEYFDSRGSYYFSIKVVTSQPLRWLELNERPPVPAAMVCEDLRFEIEIRRSRYSQILAWKRIT